MGGVWVRANFDYRNNDDIQPRIAVPKSIPQIPVPIACKLKIVLDCNKVSFAMMIRWGKGVVSRQNKPCGK